MQNARRGVVPRMPIDLNDAADILEDYDEFGPLYKGSLHAADGLTGNDWVVRVPDEAMQAVDQELDDAPFQVDIAEAVNDERAHEWYDLVEIDETSNDHNDRRSPDQSSEPESRRAFPQDFWARMMELSCTEARGMESMENFNVHQLFICLNSHELRQVTRECLLML
ncbi:hypothetical protein QAD02_018394 [Eretmocerus hayati]|uniref:Uncharacterized protein n=1 Tax=Eretmocerus hayati TaxID=131215 RepID=A0ACC2PJM9_9HYME|nr:hypothetical protein QAD02_018394 [Eretmocerus hayati]